MKRTFEDLKKELENKSYALVGNSSGVQVCKWTKNSLNGKGVCWKEKFYGIRSSGCCQFSPSLMWCEHKCVHCWRPIELSIGKKIKKVDDPKEILEKIIQARKNLLMGFKGSDRVDKKKLSKAFEPRLYTFSLAGEPTIYPRIGEMIQEIRNKKAISFVVTNGQNPSMLLKLERSNALPTQLTISTNAPNKKLYDIWHNSTNKDAWKRFNHSLAILKKLKGKCRRCIRLTLVKKGTNLNTTLRDLTNMAPELVKEYCKLIRKADPDFVHVKGFTSIGYARYRMGADKMPWFFEIKRYSKDLLKNLREKDKKWQILASDRRSCIVVLGRDKKKMKIKKEDY